MRIAICLALIGLCLETARADALDDALRALRQAPAGELAKAVEAVTKLNTEPAELVKRLRAGVRIEPIGDGWHVLAAIDEAGNARPFHLYVPKSARGDEAPPLLVHLHGGVSRPAFADRVSAYGTMWTPFADEHGFVMAFPMARGDCMWWTKNGVAHIQACIRETKRLIAIDDNRILATGFSDGASGCYHLAMAAPEPFAGFLPFNGHPAVPANLSGEQLYLHNLVHAPMLVAATRDDVLYPAAGVLEHLIAPLKRGAQIRIVSYEGGNHRPVYFEDQAASFAKFVMATKRDPNRARIEWWGASPATGTAGWLQIVEFGGIHTVPASEDINMMSTPGRIRLGINVDRAYPGPGVKVTAVTDDSNASRMGIQNGDVIHVMDGRPIGNLRDLQVALSLKKHGDDLAVSVQQGDDAPRKLATKIPAFKPEPYYKRGKQTGHVVAVRGDGTLEIKARGVTKLIVNLALEPGHEGALKVTANGDTQELKPIPIPVQAILEAYARHLDSGRVYTHQLRVAVQ